LHYLAGALSAAICRQPGPLSSRSNHEIIISNDLHGRKVERGLKVLFFGFFFVFSDIFFVAPPPPEEAAFFSVDPSPPGKFSADALDDLYTT